MLLVHISLQEYLIIVSIALQSINLIVPALIGKCKETIETCIFENKRAVLIFAYCRANSASQGV